MGSSASPYSNGWKTSHDKKEEGKKDNGGSLGSKRLSLREIQGFVKTRKEKESDRSGGAKKLHFFALGWLPDRRIGGARGRGVKPQIKRSRQAGRWGNAKLGPCSDAFTES